MKANLDVMHLIDVGTTIIKGEFSRGEPQWSKEINRYGRKITMFKRALLKIALVFRVKLLVLLW